LVVSDRLILDAEKVGSAETYKVVYASQGRGFNLVATPGVVINGVLIKTTNVQIATRRYVDRVSARLLGSAR
jgi:hypothetical protein